MKSLRSWVVKSKMNDANVKVLPPMVPQSWKMRLFWAVISVIVIGGAVLRSGLFESDLPECDSSRAKDTLSNIFKEKNLNPKSYKQIKTISSGKDLVICQATLPLSDTELLTINYKFVSSASGAQIQYEYSSGPI